MDEKLTKLVMAKIGRQFYLELWELTKKVLKVLLIFSIGYLIGLYTGIYINLEDKVFIVGCS